MTQQEWEQVLMLLMNQGFKIVAFMESFNDYVMSRIKGVGADQYMKSTGQLFETFTVKETVDELLAELADTIAYTNFIAIKVIALSNAIKENK